MFRAPTKAELEWEEFLEYLRKLERDRAALDVLRYSRLIHFDDAKLEDQRQRLRQPTLRCLVPHGLGERPRTPAPRAPPGNRAQGYADKRSYTLFTGSWR
jgi:hypothetical protein